MTTDMSIMSLVMEASFAVQVVLVILLAASFASWSIIFTKRRLIRRTKAASDDFEASFWSGGDLNTLYRAASRQKGGSSGMLRTNHRLPGGRGKGERPPGRAEAGEGQTRQIASRLRRRVEGRIPRIHGEAGRDWRVRALASSAQCSAAAS